MNGRLKAKSCQSASFAEEWPKPIFSFQGSVGHLPKEAQPYVFVSRYDAKTQKHTVVPEMMYPIQANKQPAPKHEVLEDDYRAFHNAAFNELTLRRKLAPQTVQRTSDEQGSVVSAYNSVNFKFNINTVLQHGNLNKAKETLPKLAAYIPGGTPPHGYVYRRFRPSNSLKDAGRSRQKFACPPTVIINGPFQNMVSTNHQPEVTPAHHSFPSAISSAPRPYNVNIYNEPDAVMAVAVETDFHQGLPERARPRSSVIGFSNRTNNSQ